MATLFKYFKEQSLSTSNEAELPDAVTREANKAVESILAEERSRASGRKRKYLELCVVGLWRQESVRQ